jgi:hypothetical protein
VSGETLPAPVGGHGGDGRRRIGVYVCQCGGNIGDYVNVDDVVARTTAASSCRGP